MHSNQHLSNVLILYFPAPNQTEACGHQRKVRISQGSTVMLKAAKDAQAIKSN
jgi:hypothetical protein